VLVTGFRFDIVISPTSGGLFIGASSGSAVSGAIVSGAVVSDAVVSAEVVSDEESEVVSTAVVPLEESEVVSSAVVSVDESDVVSFIVDSAVVVSCAVVSAIINDPPGKQQPVSVNKTNMTIESINLFFILFASIIFPICILLILLSAHFSFFYNNSNKNSKSAFLSNVSEFISSKNIM
jgi:hypothetical protein